MTPQEFDNIFQDTIMALEQLVSFKGVMYASDQNRLHNFDSAGNIDKESPIKACKGMWKKQLVSLLDAINKEEDYRTLPGNIPVWDQVRCDEVINDLLVYLILTKALFYRAYGWRTQSIQIKNNSPSHGSRPYSTMDFQHGVLCTKTRQLWKDVHAHIEGCTA